MGHLLGIDAGTTSLKAGVFAPDGSMLAVANEEYRLRTPMADRAELEPDRYWRALVSASRTAMDRARISSRDVSAIGVSSQGETFIPVAANGDPVGPAIVWLDNRASAEAADLRLAFTDADVYAATGVPAITPTWTAVKLEWLKRNEPKTYDRAARFLLVEDLLLHALTGRFVTEGGVQCTTLLYDIRRHDWWQPMLDRLELTSDRLPELAAPGTAVGRVREQAAEALGLSPDVVVVAGGMDQGAGAVGVGNFEPGIVSESTGGALTLQASIDRPGGDRTGRTPVYVHSAPDRYLYCPVCPTGGMALTWFRNELGQEEVARATAAGLDAYDLLTGLAAEVPPGADGLIMLPHLMGAFSPEYEPRARGAWYGFTLAHRKGHFVRAILEGVAYMLRRNLELLADAGAGATELRSHGGGARSDLWCQIKADVCGVPVATFAGDDAAIRGDAMLAGVATGAFLDLDEARTAMVSPRRRFAPSNAARANYELGYRRYQGLFASLAPMFALSGDAGSDLDPADGST